MTAKQVMPFHIQLFYDLESVSEYLSRNSMHLQPKTSIHDKDVRLNEHGQIVVTDTTYSFYRIGVFQMHISNAPKNHVCWERWTQEPLASQIDTWSLLLALQKDNLCHAYNAIKHMISSHPLTHSNQSYAPGSILTSHEGTLVGRVPIRLDEQWVVDWEEEDRDDITLSFSSTHNGSVTVTLLYAETRWQSYYATIHLHSKLAFNEILDSWIAQASQLQSCIHTRGHVDDVELSLILDTEFHLAVIPRPRRRYNSFRLCNTFMAKDHHTLLLSISAPSIDYQTNRVSWPAFTWHHMDLEMSSAEVEEVFGLELVMYGNSHMPDMSKTLLTTIPELNANYGFDPAQGGADVCKYFGWPLMEILDDTGDWIPLHGTVSESASVMSDSRYRTSSEATVSSLENTPEGEHAGEASTMTEIATAAQTIDQKLKHSSQAFIVMFIVISAILLSFIVQTYM